MKNDKPIEPCSQNKEALVALALGDLDDAAAARLRAHVSVCGGCREYAEEMSALSRGLAARTRLAEIEVPSSFHRDFVGRIQSLDTAPVWRRAVSKALLFFAVRRFMAPACAMAVVVMAVVVLRNPGATPHRDGFKVSPAPTRAQESVASDAGVSLGDYLIAADRSPDNLDALLTRQAEQSGSAAGPVYTARSRALSN